MTDREQHLAEYLEATLDWLLNLEATLGHEVLMNHAPNNIPSRLDMRRAIGKPLNYRRAPDTNSPEHRMFVKEQQRLLRERWG